MTLLPCTANTGSVVSLIYTVVNLTLLVVVVFDIVPMKQPTELAFNKIQVAILQSVSKHPDSQVFILSPLSVDSPGSDPQKVRESKFGFLLDVQIAIPVGMGLKAGLLGCRPRHTVGR
jgi:hypothetical protein